VVIPALVLVAGFPVGAAASTRVYKIGVIGRLSVEYTSSQTRQTSDGCAFHETGDAQIGWQNIWRVTAAVHPRTGHVQIKQIRMVKGPVDRRQRGDSEISGKRTNAADGSSSRPDGPPDQCSRSHMAGSYDCTAERVTPVLPSQAQMSFETSQFQPKAWDLILPSWVSLHASYAGTSPKEWSCADDVGTDFLPGGALGPSLSQSPGDAQATLTHQQLIGLKVGQHLTSQIRGNNSSGWVNDFWSTGESCAPGPHEGDYACTVEHVYRNANVIIRRVR
jgi:hypothetical protein